MPTSDARATVESAEAALAEARAAAIRTRSNLDAARQPRNQYGGVHGHRGTCQVAFEAAEEAFAAAERRELTAEAELNRIRNAVPQGGQDR